MSSQMSTLSPIRVIPMSQCKVCHQSLAVTLLHRHMKTVHAEKIGKQIQCNQCGKILQTKDRLIQHEKSHRMNLEEQQTYSCDICKYMTNCKAYFNDHKKRMHKAQAGLWMCMSGTCKENPKSFINHQQMKKHQQIHANVSCPDSNKCFGARRNMQRHIRNVHKAKNVHETSRNSNGSHTDGNLNDDPIDINNVEFDIVSQ